MALENYIKTRLEKKRYTAHDTHRARVSFSRRQLQDYKNNGRGRCGYHGTPDTIF